MQRTLLQEWTELKYFGDKVVLALEARGYKEGSKAWGGLSEWIMNAIHFQFGEQVTPEQAANLILEDLNKSA